MQQRTRSLALVMALAATTSLAGCGGAGSADLAAPAFQQPGAAISQANASPFPSNKTDIGFDELRGLMAPDDPPFSTEMTPFRQTKQFTGPNGANTTQVSINYETNDFPVLVRSEPIIRERPAAAGDMPHFGAQGLKVIQDASAGQWENLDSAPPSSPGQVIRHQAALVMLSATGKVLELDINITPGEGIPNPVPFHQGDSLILKGVYIITDPSEYSNLDHQHHNVIHWTHHGGGGHPSGHIIFKGVTYQ